MLTSSVDLEIEPATCEYGPFGEAIRATGPMAKSNPFRFSTKDHDDETDLLYYGRRYLSTSRLPWLSRDPAEEGGGNNLYCLISNDPVNQTDELGLWATIVHHDLVKGSVPCNNAFSRRQFFLNRLMAMGTHLIVSER